MIFLLVLFKFLYIIKPKSKIVIALMK